MYTTPLLFEQGSETMSYISPNSIIEIMNNIPFDPDYENTMYFYDRAEQENYFIQHVSARLEEYSYQRTDKDSIRIGLVSGDPTFSAIKAAFRASYMRFKNTSFENKWFYAFIDRVEYINNNTVELFYHIDVIQTWLLDCTFNQCMIERAHTPDDTFGAYTYPEGLETGPYRDYEASVTGTDSEGTTYTGNKYKYKPKVFLCSVLDNNDDYANGFIMPGMSYNNDSYSQTMGRMFSGARYYIYDMNTQGITDLNQKIQTITGSFGSGSKIDAVIAIFMFSADFVPNFSDIEQEATERSLIVNVPASIDGYTPRNRKLLCFPFNVLYVTNNQGGCAEYHWENFDIMDGPTVNFGVWGNISTNPGLLCAPYFYNGCRDYNYDEQLTLQGFPMCAWANDAFKAWLAQNGGTIIATGVNDALTWVNALRPETNVKGLLKDKTGAAISAAQQTISHLGKLWDYSVQPPQAHGNTNGSLQFQSGLLTFSFYYKQIKREYAEKLDDYFDMYGYKIMRVGFPQLAIRPCYTYIKTIGCSIEANLPNNYVSEIERIFDAGIRFWRTTAIFGNYNSNVNNNRPT